MSARTLVLSRITSFICFLTLLLILAYPAVALESSAEAVKKERVLERVEAVKERVEARKEIVAQKVDDRKAKMASREAALKAKLETFKNKTKAALAEKVNTNLNKINQNRTDNMQAHLDNMSTILNKLEARINSGNPDIKDPASANVALTQAKEVIATTSAAVITQAEKDYTIEITSESRVKADASSKRQELHQDLLSLRKMIIDAKQAVTNAIRIAKGGQTVGQL